jgi:hypothetical protein
VRPGTTSAQNYFWVPQFHNIQYTYVKYPMCFGPLTCPSALFASLVGERPRCHVRSTLRILASVSMRTPPLAPKRVEGRASCTRATATSAL